MTRLFSKTTSRMIENTPNANAFILYCGVWTSWSKSTENTFLAMNSIMAKTQEKNNTQLMILVI